MFDICKETGRKLQNIGNKQLESKGGIEYKGILIISKKHISIPFLYRIRLS